MKKITGFFIGLFLCSLSTLAQEGTTVFNFLQLPLSSHAAALGGENISIIEDDITLSMHNPALLSCVSDKTLNLNYMTYMSGSKVVSAAFNKTFGERSTAAIATQYVDYGSFDGYTEENISTGSFSASDFALYLMYSYLLNDYWSGGVSGKVIYSKYESFNSFALAVDLGINYYNDEKTFSASLAIKNLGGQLKAFDENYEKVPLDVVLGISKDLAHAPFRFSLTLNNLNHWDSSYFYNADGEEDGFGELFLKHCLFGVDYIPSQNFYLSVGYNYRLSKELSGDSGSWEGFTAGIGITLKRIKIGASYSKLHVSSSSLLFNLSYSL